MDNVETEGDTIDKAIENALKLLGVGRDKITVDILSEEERDLRLRLAESAHPCGLRKSAIDLQASELPPSPWKSRPTSAETAATAEKAKESGRDIELMEIKQKSN
jgi:hypothetical protein